MAKGQLIWMAFFFHHLGTQYGSSWQTEQNQGGIGSPVFLEFPVDFLSRLTKFSD